MKKFWRKHWTNICGLIYALVIISLIMANEARADDFDTVDGMYQELGIEQHRYTAFFTYELDAGALTKYCFYSHVGNSYNITISWTDECPDWIKVN